MLNKVNKLKAGNLSSPPTIHPIRKVRTPNISEYRIEGDIPVKEVRKKDCGVVLIDLVFHAGRPQEHKPIAASATAMLLREGAGAYSSKVFSEEIDFLGATLSCTANLDFTLIKVVCLKKQLPEITKLLCALLSDPHFEKEEWELYRNKSLERLKVQLSKSDIMSYRMITEAIYGPTHPYGYNSKPEHYDQIVVDDLRHHYESYITARNCELYLAGDWEASDREYIDQIGAHIRKGGLNGRQDSIWRQPTKPTQLKAKGNPSQCSIRLASHGCKRNHPDYYCLNLLSNVFGGYFGSRLVTKIREEMGLTYGIYSSLDTQLHDGDIMISTEVAPENVHQCIDQIYKEMNDLKTTLISDEELNMVKNYMMGNYLNLFDGPFNSIRTIKSLALASIPLDNLDTLIEASLSYDAHNLRDMANKYLNRRDFWEVIVGTPQE